MLPFQGACDIGLAHSPGRCPGLYVSKAFSLWRLSGLPYILRGWHSAFGGARPAGAAYTQPNAARGAGSRQHSHCALKGQHILSRQQSCFGEMCSLPSILLFSKEIHKTFIECTQYETRRFELHPTHFGPCRFILYFCICQR